MTIFGTAMSRQAKENVCDAQSIPVRLHCPFENCHKSYDSKKHINEHFLSTAMHRHVLNSKTTPQAARGCGIRHSNFWPRPFHDVTRSPGGENTHTHTSFSSCRFCCSRSTGGRPSINHEVFNCRFGNGTYKARKKILR